MTRGEAALECAGFGWLVFPIYEIQANGTCSCGMKCPTPGKHPRVKWTEEATGDEWHIRQWWNRWPHANLGIVTGRRSNLFVLDIDTKRSVELADGTLVPEGEYTLVQLESECDTLPDTLVVRTGSGGQHWYFTYPGTGDHPNRVGFAPGLDIRADDGYVVGPGSNHTSGHDYEWLIRLPPALPPQWLVDRATARDHGPTPVSDLDGAIGEGGRNVFLTRWAGRYRHLDPGLGEDDLSELLWTKNQQKCQPPLAVEEVRKIAHSAMRYVDRAEPEVVLEAGESRAGPEIPEGADLAWSLSAFMRLEITPPEPLVPGLMDAGTGIMIAGPGGIGKSWLVDHLALAIATGTPFLDKFPVKQGPVLLIDEEGHPYGDQERFRMLLNGYEIGSIVDVPLYLTVRRGIKIDTPLGLALLQRLVGRYIPKLVIIDSLIRVSSGDEANAREMANFFAVADTIKQSTGCGFLFVHHCKKPGNEMPADLGDLVRGSTEIKNWLDTLFIALPGETSTDMTVHLNKQRWHAQPEHPFVVRRLTRDDQPWARLGYQGEYAGVDHSTIGTRNRLMAVVQDLIQRDLEPTPVNIGANMALGESTVRAHLQQLVAMGLLIASPSVFGKKGAFTYRPGEDPPVRMNGGGGNGLLHGPGPWSLDH